MKKKNQFDNVILFATMLGFTACSDDDKVSISTAGITTTVDTILSRAATDRWNLYFEM